MKITERQLRRLIREEAKLATAHRSYRFEDVSPFAHKSGLYEAVGNLHEELRKFLGSDLDAEKWLRRLTKDALESQIDDYSTSRDDYDTSRL